jgi:hypothetical protein
MSSPSPASVRVALIGCGALSTDIAEICEQRGWAVDHFPLPPLLHNSPKEIAPRVEALILELKATHERIAIAYADCGTYGALDEVCSRYGVERLGGDHCYDLYAGADVIADLSRQEPGTYFLTDFLVLGFDRLVWRELGLDRHPDLRDDYFRHYRRVVWLASRDTPDMRRAAERAAGRIELPLVVRELARSGEEGRAPFAQSLAVLLDGTVSSASTC